MKRNTILACLLLVLPALAGAQQPLPLPFRKGNLWGFVDENRRFVIPALYDEVRAFQDSIMAFYQYNGQLQRLKAAPWPEHLITLRRSLDRLRDSLYAAGTRGADGDWQAYVFGAEQLLLYQPDKPNIPSAVIFDRYGHRLLENLAQIQYYNGALDYVQDGYYRQWQVPLMGRYVFEVDEYVPNRQNGNFIGNFTCGQGLFRADGTCLIPVRCGQSIEYDYWLKAYVVSCKGEKDLFDATAGVFRTAAARYLPYHNFNMSPGYTPAGYFEVEIDGKSGIIRVTDGAAFFEN